MLACLIHKEWVSGEHVPVLMAHFVHGCQGSMFQSSWPTLYMGVRGACSSPHGPLCTWVSGEQSPTRLAGPQPYHTAARMCDLDEQGRACNQLCDMVAAPLPWLDQGLVKGRKGAPTLPACQPHGPTSRGMDLHVTACIQYAGCCMCCLAARTPGRLCWCWQLCRMPLTSQAQRRRGRLSRCVSCLTNTRWAEFCAGSLTCNTHLDNRVMQAAIGDSSTSIAWSRIQMMQRGCLQRGGGLPET
jgi:hypothetical protein